MATITLTANTDYSALTLANDDIIDCAGFILTLDIQPTETNIEVRSPGTNGRVVFDGAWALTTWDFVAGHSTSAGMIGTLPSGAEIRSITGGSSVSNARGVGTNEGVIGTSTGGSSTNSYGVYTNDGLVGTSTGGSGGGTAGVVTNNGTVESAIGGSGGGTAGVVTNNGTVESAIGGSAISSQGVSTNNGTVVAATGGSASNSYCINSNPGIVKLALGGSASGAHGARINTGTVESAVGGSVSGAHGVDQGTGRFISATGGSVSGAYGARLVSGGTCFRIQDDVELAIDSFTGTSCLVDGPRVKGVIPDNIKTIYSLGPLAPEATIAGDATVIDVSIGGSGGGGSSIRSGFRTPSFSLGPGAF